VLKAVGITATTLGGALLANSALEHTTAYLKVGTIALVIGLLGLTMPEYSQQGDFIRKVEETVAHAWKFVKGKSGLLGSWAKRIARWGPLIWPGNWK
jgi:hypothetical protein